MVNSKISAATVFSKPISNDEAREFYPSQVLIYTRPWEVRFHIALGKALQQHYHGIPLRFASFFSWAHDYIKKAGLESVYLPDELAAVSGDELSGNRLKALDNELHQRLGAGLYLMLNSERFLPKEGELADQFLKKHVVILDRLVQPGTLSISAMYDHFCYWLAGSLANIRNGAHFAFVVCGVPGRRVLALRTPWQVWQAAQIDDDGPHLTLESAKKDMEKPSATRMEYMGASQTPSVSIRCLNRLKEIRMNEKDYQAKSYFATRWHVWDRFLSIRKSAAIAKRNDSLMDITDEEGVPANKFIYVPLHVEPEASILMYSPWLRDQTELVRLIAQALPFGATVLVKENPKMLSQRSPEFLQYLKTIPGVQLIHPKCSSTYLSKKAVCTVSLAGTACLEAALLGKNSLVTGNPPFTLLLPEITVNSGKELHERLSSLVREQSCSIKSISQQAWGCWLKASFKGSVVPLFKKPDGSVSPEMQIDYGQANVYAYVRFILSCLE